jgi:hypothetical protein
MNDAITVTCDLTERPHYIATFLRHAPSPEWDWIPRRSARVNRAWKAGIPEPADGPQIMFESGQGHVTARLGCDQCKRGTEVRLRADRLDAVLTALLASGVTRVSLRGLEEARRSIGATRRELGH